jgi:hypothetical protein
LGDVAVELSVVWADNAVLAERLRVFDYETLTEDELLHLAGERIQLTDEARMALDAELSRRKLSAGDLVLYERQCAAAVKEERLRRAAPKTVSSGSFGKRFLGKSNRRRDPSGGFELYESTLWFVVFWFPVYPIATFTVRRNLEPWLGMVFASSPIALERHARNWEQILLTWVKATLVLWAILFLFTHPEWLKHLPNKNPS